MQKLQLLLHQPSIFKEVEKILFWYNLNCNLLKCVTMECGKTGKGLFGQIYKLYENNRCLKPVDVHFCVNQQAACCKYLNLLCIEPVVSKLCFIQFFRNNYYHFYGFFFFCQIKSQTFLLCHTPIHWFCNGNILLQYFEQRAGWNISEPKTPPSTIIVKYWIGLEISFSCRLDMFSK